MRVDAVTATAQNSAGKTVDEEQIASVLSSWSGIPVVQLQEEEKERLLKLESILHERVVGQNEAVESIAKAVRRAWI